MPRPKNTIPSYKLHKASGQAIAYVDRRIVYLGPYGSPESKKAFAALIDELQAGPGANVSTNVSRSVAELLLKYATEHLPRYSKDEQHCQRGAIRIARELFGETPANDFGPLRLRAVRDAMLQGADPDPETAGDKGRKPWSASFTNKQIKRLRYVFRIGVSWEYVSQTVADALASVPALEVTGGTRRKAIPDATIKAVRAKLKKELHVDLFDLMLLTCARPGELLSLTGEMIETAGRGKPWRAELDKHKTTHFGKDRVLFFNTKAQGILKRYLTDDPSAKLFKIRREHFGRVVRDACDAAGVDRFTPHWLRHTAVTWIADAMGVEAAQRLAGHADAAMTEHYAKSAEKLASEAAKRLGKK